MRRDEQLDDLERTVSRLRMDNDALREEVANWMIERDALKVENEKMLDWLKFFAPIVDDVVETDVGHTMIKQAKDFLAAHTLRKV